MLQENETIDYKIEVLHLKGLQLKLDDLKHLISEFAYRDHILRTGLQEYIFDVVELAYKDHLCTYV